MEMVNSHSIRRLSTASAPKIAKQCCPIVIVCNFKNALYSNGCFYRQFLTLFYRHTYIYPGIHFRLPCTPQDNFSWVPNCSLGPPGWETKVSSKKFWFGLCEIAWFLCQPIANLRRGVCL